MVINATRSKFILQTCAAFVTAMLGLSALTAAVRSQQSEGNTVQTQQLWAAVAKGRVDVEGGTIRLAAQREGLIKDVLVEEGDHVTKGQVLARIDTASAELAFNQSKADLTVAQAQIPVIKAKLAAAQRELRRLSPLAKMKAVSGQDLDQAKDLVETQKAELEAAKAYILASQTKVESASYEIEARSVKSPLDGRIVKRSAKPGDGISTQTVSELFLLAPDTPRIVRAELDEQMIAAVKPGQAAVIALEFDPTKTYAGKVLRVGEVFGLSKNKDDPNAQVDTRVVEMVAEIENAEGLRIGQRVLVQVKP